MSPALSRKEGLGVIGPLIAFLAVSLAPVQAQDSTASQVAFKFTTVDNKLLDEVTEYNRQLEKKGLIFHDADLDAYINTIGQDLIAHQPQLENVHFRFRVLRDPMVNACAFPDGSIYVNTGLLAVLENEAQLASIFGHEATHVINRHMYLENRSMRKKVLAINILEGIASNMPAGSTFGAAVALGANLSAAILVGTIYGYSQDKERDADRHGFELMVAASYDPHAMPRTFELLDERLEFEPLDTFYRTHPKLEERHRTAMERIQGVQSTDARMGGESEYLAHAAPAICANIEADLNCRRARTAVARALRLQQWNPAEPRYRVLLADAYRALGAKTAEPTVEEEGRHGQAEHRKLYFRMTEQEEQARLLTKPEGSAARSENFSKSEALYRRTIEQNPDYALAHRGLGFLYEQEGNNSEAAREYRKYLDLTADTNLDHLRIARRLAQIEKTMQPGPAPQK